MHTAQLHRAHKDDEKEMARFFFLCFLTLPQPYPGKQRGNGLAIINHGRGQSLPPWNDPPEGSGRCPGQHTLQVWQRNLWDDFAANVDLPQP